MAGKKSVRADKTPPRKNLSIKQMVDIRGFPLVTEQGAPLVTEKEAYPIEEYGQDNALPVVLDPDSYANDGLSTQNVFSRSGPAFLPIIEQFPEQSEVSRSLLGIERQTTQQGLFGNVSSYGLDEKDWRVDADSSDGDESIWWWTRRPTASGAYFPFEFKEDSRNSALVISSNPTPYLNPSRPDIQDQLINPGGAERYGSWGQYINSVVALYLFKYMVKNFTRSQWEQFNLLPTLSKYPPLAVNGSYEFNELYWDKLWLDILQGRFGSQSNRPIIPKGRAYNFNESEIPNWRSNFNLWGSSSVFITQSDQYLPATLDVSWDSFFFSTTRVYYPDGLPEERGHFRIRTNPTARIWEKYFGLRWNELRTDLKNWEFKIHPNINSVTQLEKDLKLPYFVLDTPVVADSVNNTFSNFWPSQSFGEEIDLPTNSNRIGGKKGVRSEIILKSIRSFRYQPGRISGFTYGVKVTEVGAGPGTVLEFGIENDTDSYMFRLSNGKSFSVVRRSTVPLETTVFLEDAEYAPNTTTITRVGQTQYETVIEQKIMNGDPLGGEGETGYILNPDTVTMYKIEFGWYGAIGARFYAYVPVENDQCRWVTLHTLVIENQLGQPCLADPFFYFKYRLLIKDSSEIRIDQLISKFGASYYIDGYDEGTLYSLNAQSRVNYLSSPEFNSTKTVLNAIDWTTLMGIKPRQFITNRFGTELYNKKEIFPENLFVHSQKDCEIKIVRQRGCPEWAFTHQEGYRWSILPENRRLKAKFAIDPYYQLDFTELSISPNNPTALATYSVPSTGGFRDITDPSNWNVVGNQVVRILGEDLYALYASQKFFSGSGVVFLKLQRDSQINRYLSSRRTSPAYTNVYLPFTYAPVAPYEQGYDIEVDYFRRDQILLSTVDILSDQFYIYWVGGSMDGVIPGHTSGIRIGFTWSADPSDPDWAVEPDAVYDGQTFESGLPFDFVKDYAESTLYVETNPVLILDTYNLEVAEDSSYYFTDIDSNSNGEGRLSVPGTEGGLCRGLYCKSGREIKENVLLFSETIDGVTKYYVSDTGGPWPNLSPENFSVTLVQGGTVRNVQTVDGGGFVRSEGEITQYLLPIASIPSGIVEGTLNASYNIVYIATLNKRSEVKQILVSRIAPSNVKFIRAFIQGRQGAYIGGAWIGQKTSRGIRIDPFTPHRSTVSLSDGAAEAGKAIETFTHIDPTGKSTAPTISLDPLETYKSVHSSPKKCGSFLSAGGVNSAGIMSSSDYPIRWLTSGSGIPLATYYVSANTPTEIDLTSVFNVSAESIVNEDDGNLGTFFIARSLNNHDETENEIYLSLNYSEQ